jgi:hypothetical protein
MVSWQITAMVLLFFHEKEVAILSSHDRDLLHFETKLQFWHAVAQ